jgi:hypothetical protein
MYIYDNSGFSSQNEKYLEKSCRENQNPLLMFNNCFFENHAVYEIKLKNYGTGHR